MDINDMDAIQMIWILRRMRDEGHYLDGREIKFPPKFFLGAAASPFASDPKFQALREHKKVNAGAQFFQTNLVYDPDRMEIWLNEIAKRNILDKVYILIGITPLKSAKMTHYMTQVPGVYVPEPIIKRMEDAEDKGGPHGAQEEGVKIALEIIEKIKGKTRASTACTLCRSVGKISCRVSSPTRACCRRILSHPRQRQRKHLRERLPVYKPPPRAFLHVAAGLRQIYSPRKPNAWNVLFPNGRRPMLPEQIKNFREMVTLKDGTYVLLRPMLKEDEARLVEFYSVASDDDLRYLRHNVREPAVIREWCDRLDYEKVLPVLAFAKERVGGMCLTSFL